MGTKQANSVDPQIEQEILQRAATAGQGRRVSLNELRGRCAARRLQAK